MKYTVISDERLEPRNLGIINMAILDENTGLIAKVAKYIAQGWKPMGGVSFGAGYYLQAMISEDEEE